MENAALYTETGAMIPFQFNPTDLTISKSVTWQAAVAKGANAPTLNFQGGQSGTVSLQMTLDATTTGVPVTDATDKLLALVSVNTTVAGADPQRGSARPPWVEFHWGLLHAPFRAVVERLQIKYTYFSASGVPLRAKVDVGLKQFDDQDVRPRQNPTSSTPAPHTVHQIAAGETLDRIAATRYGDPTRWRILADANGITDPLRLTPGDTLLVPQLPVVTRGR